jgi:hypothetical protein
MPSVPNAGSRDHYTLDATPVPAAKPWQVIANALQSGRFDAIIESIDRWLARLMVAAVLLTFIATRTQMPFAPILLETALSIMVLGILYGLVVHVGKRFRLVGKDVLKDKSSLDAAGGLVAIKDKLPAQPVIETKVEEAAPKRETEASIVAGQSQTHRLAIKGRGTITYRIVNDDRPAAG